MNRRDFIVSAVSAAAFAGCGRRSDRGPNLRIGVVSDIHWTTKRFDDELQNCSCFETALRYFDLRKADGVLMAGDLSDIGTEDAVRDIGAIWDWIFPGGRRSDGEPVVNLFHYGDHDMGGYMQKYPWAKKYCANKGEIDRIIPLGDPGKLWEECFHEKWAPIQVKRVKGYTFVLAHHPVHDESSGQGNRIPGLAAFMKTVKTDPGRPFFYSQHRHFAGSDTGEVLKGYPNVIALHGHLHMSCVDELSLDQDAFTRISIPSLNYNVNRGGHEIDYGDRNPELLLPMLSCAKTWQGLFMSVYDDRIVIERRDFLNGCPLGPDWMIPLPSPDGSLRKENRARRAVPPEFAASAQAKVRTLTAKNRGKTKDVPQVRVVFPVAHATARTPRAYDYEVVVQVGAKTVARKQVFSRGCYFADAKDVEPVECAFPIAELPPNWRDAARFVVTPRDSFGTCGSSLVATLS